MTTIIIMAVSLIIGLLSLSVALTKDVKKYRAILRKAQEEEIYRESVRAFLRELDKKPKVKGEKNY